MPTPREQLLGWFEKLSAEDRRSLVDFAQFLAQRAGSTPLLNPVVAPVKEPEPLPEPKAIERPESEKVVAAIKRLSQTYFMLDKTRMLGHTSGLMTQHIMAGRDAVEVIDELEQVFRKEYETLKAQAPE
jgi:hypothetical protein